jgi:cytochrome c-type biogenesis protein CcmF
MTEIAFIPSFIEFGHFSLLLALVISLCGVVIPAYGFIRRDIALQNMAFSAMRLTGLLLSLSFLILIYAFVTSDFSVALVVANSHSLKPLLYKIAGTWGNHEGSLLLWIWLIALYGVFLSRNKHDPHRALAVTIQQGLIVQFLLLLVLTSNPFTRVFPPALNGNDLNPLLQDPALAFHPPLLYAGYVGYSVVFALAMAGLWRNQINQAWAKMVRPWAMIAWLALTAGLALGSWWAYYELGWGGWWFWDPVENAALLPWLTGTALMHSIIVLERRGHLPNWTVLLAILCFTLSLLGTFLVRSGVITSVHAFASDPTRGVFILVILAVILGSALLVYGLKKPHTLHDAPALQLFSREGALTINNMILIAGMVTVMIGTLYPLVLDALTGILISVGPPYYALTFVPLMIPMLCLMAMSPFIAWGQYQFSFLWKRIETFSLITAAIMVGLLWWKTDLSLWSMLCFAAGLWVVISALAYWFERAQYKIRNLFPQPLTVWALVLGHLGLGLAVLGMVGSSFWVQSHSAWLAQNDTMPIGQYHLTLSDLALREGHNYNSDTAILNVMRGSDKITQLEPEKRWYPVAGKDTSEIAMMPTQLGNLYVALGTEQPHKPGTWMVRAYIHPLVNLLWAGVAVMLMGGVCALFSYSDRKRKSGL